MQHNDPICFTTKAVKHPLTAVRIEQGLLIF